MSWLHAPHGHPVRLRPIVASATGPNERRLTEAHLVGEDGAVGGTPQRKHPVHARQLVREHVGPQRLGGLQDAAGQASRAVNAGEEHMRHAVLQCGAHRHERACLGKVRLDLGLWSRSDGLALVIGGWRLDRRGVRLGRLFVIIACTIARAVAFTGRLASICPPTVV